MATLNLGRIKPVFRGAYSGSTAYVVDDIVTSGGSTYICIQAHGAGTQAVNQTAYWTLMAEGGDVASTVTTQGDILYRDGSGLQRLAKGTAGQVLKMNTSANAPEWGTDAGGSILAVSHKTDGTTLSVTNQCRTTDMTFTGASYEWSALTITMTPSSNTSKFMLQCNLQAGHYSSYVGMGWLTYQVSGGTEYAITSSGTKGLTFRYDADTMTSSNAGNPSIACCVVASPATTSDVTFRVRLATANSGHPWYCNRAANGATDQDDGGYMLSTFTVYELAGGNTTVGNTATNNTKT